MDLLDERALLGAAILSAQKFEFGLLGLVAHLSDEQKERRFRGLTPEKFFRGSPKDLKATLGQLEVAFGDKLLIRTSELKGFVKDRNLIAHDYWRLTKSNIKGGEKLNDPESFLRDFLVRCDHWNSVLRGLACVFTQVLAQREGRLAEINFSEQQLNDIAAYYAHVSLHLSQTTR